MTTVAVAIEPSAEREVSATLAPGANRLAGRSPAKTCSARPRCERHVHRAGAGRIELRAAGR